MYNGQIVFSQLIEFLPKYYFNKYVEKYKGNYRIRTFSCWDQFLCMSFAQLTYRESLRDIEACLRSLNTKLYHIGIRDNVSRSTLAKANEKRDWRIYANFAQILIHKAKKLYINEPFGVDKATSPHKSFLWYIRKCGQNANMDCSLYVLTRRNNEKSAQNRTKPLHNFTDIECNHF